MYRRGDNSDLQNTRKKQKTIKHTPNTLSKKYLTQFTNIKLTPR